MAVESLDQLAVLVVRPRALFLDIYARHGGWQPAPGSLAETELAATLFPDANENRYLVRHPLSVASLHVRVGADYLAGMAPLIIASEILFAPFALARIALEHSVRTVWLLNWGVPHRQRSARALLEDIVSADIERVAWKHLAGRGDEAYKAKLAVLTRLRECAERCFDDVSFPDSRYDWTIEGQTYPRPTAVVRAWNEIRTHPMQAEALYEVLSTYVHPQSFPSRPEATFNESEESMLRADPELLRKLTAWAVAAWIEGARLMYLYQGWDAPELDQMAAEAEAVNP